MDSLFAGAWKNCEDKFFISGANNPYGVIENGQLAEDVKHQVLERLTDAKVCVVPDWVANSGTAQLFHRILSVPFDLAQPSEVIAEQVLTACNAPISTYINIAFSKYAKGDLSRLASGCATLAKERLAHPRSFRVSAGLDSDAFAYPNPAGSRYVLPPPKQELSTDGKMQILSELIDGMHCECVSAQELSRLLKTCRAPVAYDGFEPSGRVHIAQALMKTNLVNKMTKCGFTYIFWVADWFALLNHKMGGDLEKIKVVGRYMIEVWKASGMDMSRVRFLWASEEFDKYGSEYWARVLDISTVNNLKRVQRCTQIMGRKESDSLSASQIFYPAVCNVRIFSSWVLTFASWAMISARSTCWLANTQLRGIEPTCYPIPYHASGAQKRAKKYDEVGS